MYKSVPKVFFPIIWFEQRATMTPEMATSLLGLLALPSGGATMGLVMVVAGVGIIIVALSCCIHSKVTESTTEKRYLKLIQNYIFSMVCLILATGQMPRTLATP